MSREEYFAELRRELQALPKEEQESALQYYIDYFDDAGADKVQDVIEHLGSPQKIASIIIAEYTGIQVANTQKAEKQEQSKNNNKALWLIIAILGFPIWFPLLVAGAVTIFAVFFAIAAVFFALVIVAIVLVVSGSIMFGAGLISVVPSPLGGALALGGGMCLVGIGVSGTIFMIWVCTRVIPALFRFAVKLCSLPFSGRENC